MDEPTRLQLEHALAYLQQGWHLVFMNDGEKGPKTADWNTPSQLVTTPEQVIQRLTTHGRQNMGVCHQPSGTCAIDVDHEDHTRLIWGELGIDYEDTVMRGLRIWSKPGRDKVIFRCLDMSLIKTSWPAENAVKATDRLTIFELRAGPSQDVLPPSRHPDGHFYQWWPGSAPWDRKDIPELPANVLQMWQALADRNSGLREEIQNMCPWKPAPVGKRYVQRARQVSTANGDVIGAFNAARDVGDLLEAGGYKKKGRRYLAPSSSTVIPGVVVLDGKCYSHHGSDILADGYAHDAFDLSVILHHNGDVGAAIRAAAEELGISRDQAAPDLVIDVAAALAAQARRRAGVVNETAAGEPQAALSLAGEPQNADVPVLAIHDSRIIGAEVARKPTPPHLLKPPGMVGEVVEWILQNSQRPQPLLAVGAALTMFGTVLGRKIASDTGLRTNLYVVGVAGTGRGKDRARVAIRNILDRSGMADNIGGEDFASGPGLLARVAKCPATLFVPDEFGMLVATISSKTAASHERSVMKALLTLYNSTETIVRGAERADQKMHARVDIKYPCVNMYGVTTPESFYPALSGIDVASGWLNRILVLTAPKARPAFQSAVMGDVPERFIDWIKTAQLMAQGNTKADADAGNVIVVPTSGMAGTLFLQFQAWLEAREDQLDADHSKAGLSSLWARSWEMAVKVAMILAVGKVTDLEALRGGTVEIDLGSAQWAIDFVRHFMADMEREVSLRVGDSELDRIAQDVVRVLPRGGQAGLTIAELNRLSRPFKALADLKKQQALMELLRARDECVLVETLAGNGRKRLAYVATAYFAAETDATQRDTSVALPLS